MSAKNTICIWYDGEAEAAARFYASVFPDSAVGAIHRAPMDTPGNKEGDVLVVAFTVCGIPCIGLNGGAQFPQTEAFSFQIATDTQDETDRYWDAIVGNGGQESVCGWCKDRWGVNWQITPRTLTDALAAGGDEARRAFAAMMDMTRIDVAAIDAARRGDEGADDVPGGAIRVEALVAASPEVAWAAFTSPGAIMEWNHASPEWHCPAAAVDLRPGGRHIARMEARDGSFGFDFEGIYEEVDAPSSLTLRLLDGRRARTSFRAEGSGTRVVTTFDPDASHPAEAQREGWQAILDNFAAFVDRPRP